MISIRPISIEDAEVAAELAAELGYPVTSEQMSARIADLCARPGHAAFVASEGDQVLGWIDLCVEQHLQSDARARIGGLVVSEKARGQGVGALLCRHAEAWALEQGFDSIMLTSRSTRTRAHAFYLRDGYEQVKMSAVFEKKLK